MAPRIAALYLRVSTEGQAKKELPIEGQKQEMQQWCKENGYTVVDDFVFVDLGLTGTNENRPGLQKMMALGARKNPPFEVVLVWSFSRFMRQEEEAIIHKALLKKNGVRVVSITEPIPDGPYAQILERFIEVEDANFSRKLSMATARGIHTAALKGHWTNPMQVPFGFKLKKVIEEEQGVAYKLAIDEERADVVVQMFQLAISGYSLKQIGSRFNMTKRRVVSMLKNKNYTGNRSVRKRKTGEVQLVVKNAHPAIIDATTFKKAGRALKSRRKGPLNKGKIGNHIFTGLLRCKCDSPMYHLLCNNGKSDVVNYKGYYRCTNEKCQAKSVREDKLLDLLYSKLDEVIFSRQALRDIVAMAESKRANDEIALARDYVTNELAKAHMRQQRLIDQIEEGNLRQDMISDRMAKINDDIFDLEMRLSTMEQVDDKPITLNAVVKLVDTIKRQLKSKDEIKRKHAMQSIVASIKWQENCITVKTKLMDMPDEFEIDYVKKPVVPSNVDELLHKDKRHLVRTIRNYTNDKSITGREIQKLTSDQADDYILRYKGNQSLIDGCTNE